QPAGAKTADGRLWFPTQDGVVTIDPSRITRRSALPSIVVEQVASHGIRIESDESTPIRIAPSERDLQIDYTAPTFLEPNNVRFRYRLEKYDAEWVDAGNRRTAFYTKLPPGTYTFLVEATTEGGVWETASAPVVLSVAAQFYETAVAKLLLILLVGAM